MAILDRLLALFRPERADSVGSSSSDKKKPSCMLNKNSTEFTQMLIDAIPNPVFYKDNSGVYKLCNTAFAEGLGLSKEEVVGKTVYDVFEQKLADIYHEADKRLIQTGDKQTYETKARFNDGLLHDVIITKAVFTDEKDEFAGLVGVIIDITERKVYEEKIQKLLNLKEAILEINHAIFTTSNIYEFFDLILEKVTQSMENAELGSILFLQENDTLVMAAYKGFDPQKAENVCIDLKESFIWRKTKGRIEETTIINDICELIGGKYPSFIEGNNIQSSITAPIIIEGKLIGLVNIYSRKNNIYDENDVELMEYMRNQIAIAVTKHRLFEETIYYSRHDRFNNVYNIRYFEELINTHIKKASRYKENFLLVVFDLNNLKHVNDTYGHLAGDELIKTFVASLKKEIRASDILARYGGDEFIAVFFETTPENLRDKFERLIIKLKETPLVFQDEPIICSFSYGIAQFPQDGSNYTELVNTADQRMYAHKQMSKTNL